MSYKMNLYRVVFIMLVILDMKNFAIGMPTVPCYFIFGDSLVDSCNNNALQTSAKANYAPYGVDFLKGPTGRFTNGQTVADIIAKYLGFEDYIPPFATVDGSEILQGVNYASGACGICDESGQHQGDCISLSEQLANHRTTVSRIADLLGSNKTASSEHLSNCLYSFTIGNNDYINNYFMPQFYNTSQLYTPEEYARVLVEQYSNQIRTLYHQGARKTYMVGVGLIGCTPNATATYPTDGSVCVDKMNYAATIFNKQLRSVVEKLNSEFNDAKFVFADPIKMVSRSSSSSAATVSVYVLVGRQMFILLDAVKLGENGLCIPGKSPCQNRFFYIFWDSFHPTETFNKLQANKTLTSVDPSELYPMNVLQLAQLPTKS